MAALAAVMAVPAGHTMQSASAHPSAHSTSTAAEGALRSYASARDPFSRSASSSYASGTGPASPSVTAADLTKVVRGTCVMCHNKQLMTGNLSLEDFDVAKAADRREVAEKMIRKLRAGMMPPPGMPRPGGDTLLALVETLEQTIDRFAAANPNPGSRPFQRLNRAEYKAAVNDLLGLDVNPGEWLPLDTYLANFDNMSNAQTLSPEVVEAYLTAANEVARLALGNPKSPLAPKTWDVPRYVSQNEWDHIEGTPEGTRGGLAVQHHFPADGEYVFDLGLWMGDVTRFENVDISIDGERVALVPVEVLDGDSDMGPNWSVRTDPIVIKAGAHQLAAAFIRQTEGLYEDVIRPPDWSMAGTRQFETYGHTVLPHLKWLTVTGPYNPTGVTETETRRRIFSCRPVAADQNRACAEQIVSRLATKAYRKPVEGRDLERLMAFYDEGSKDGGFEAGILTALEAVLASPHFIFRIEQAPEKTGDIYRLNDRDLAARLSWFLWDTPPDDRLLELAQRGKLGDEKVLLEEARRMLADPRSEALSRRFATSWLRLQDMNKVQPDAFYFPDFSEQLREDMRHETQLFFNSLVREDGSLLDLFMADYTFLNERLARHYDIEGVVGESFRRVQYPDARRRGLLGHGSVLLLTSMGNRTSPVLRGKWVMEVLLGTPPPPPPPGVPDLEQTKGEKSGRFLTTRERMEIHRAAPVCRACHMFMDPIGNALDNFDLSGKWRIRENGMPLDTRGTYYDGTELSTPSDLATVIAKRPIPLVRTFTENLLAYATARRVEYYDQPTVRAIARDAERNGYRISSFILGVVKSPAFRMRSTASEPMATAMAGAAK